jgi:hypothetical protein
MFAASAAGSAAALIGRVVKGFGFGCGALCGLACCGVALCICGMHCSVALCPFCMLCGLLAAGLLLAAD